MQNFNETNDLNENFKPFQKNDEIEELLRGEMSAAEAYRQVMESLNKDPEAQRLRTFLEDHNKAVDYWKSQVSNDRSVEKNGSGVWGKAVKTFVGASKLFGNSSALTALREGEEYGLSEYKDLLESEDITTQQKEEIRSRFIPQQEKHIDSLNAMIKLQ